MLARRFLTRLLLPHQDGPSCLFQQLIRCCSVKVSPEEYGKRDGERSFLNVKKILEQGAEGDVVRIQGWVRGFRKQKANVFFEVNDGSTHKRIQVIADSSAVPKTLGMHSSVDVTGILKPMPHKPAFLEVHPTSEVKVVGACSQDDYPLRGKTRYEMDYIRQYIHLRAKTNKFSSLFRLRSHVSKAIQDYFTQNDFTQIHTPILTSNDCEGAGETFLVKPSTASSAPEGLSRVSEATATDSTSIKASDDGPRPKRKIDPDTAFFDRKVYLAVSGQLHLEAMTSGLGRVWTMSPVFRAENSRSTRHLAEFYMVEAEVAFAYELRKVLDVMEYLVKSVIQTVLTVHKAEWDFFTSENRELEAQLYKTIHTPFTVMTYSEASHLLETKGNSKVDDAKGLSREQELMLVEELNNNIPIFVVDWPTKIKPFYVRRSPGSSSTCSAVDLLVPGVGELCGGSLREDSVSDLIERIKLADSSGEALKSLDWYLDLRRFGGIPTGGFGLGFERLMLYILGSKNIKDITPFPRWTHNCPL